MMSETVTLSFEINRDSLSALRKDPEHFLPEMRLAAAVKWYELGLVSQSKAAEIAGVSFSFRGFSLPVWCGRDRQ
jgi:predicted HTH domain antitoxin